jgi:hypothetical protein
MGTENGVPGESAGQVRKKSSLRRKSSRMKRSESFLPDLIAISAKITLALRTK